MRIPLNVQKVGFTGRFLHSIPEDIAREKCLEKLRIYAVGKGYPRVPDSWINTFKHKLDDEYLYSLSVEAAPPPTFTAFWHRGKKYTTRNPEKVSTFRLGFQGVGTPYVEAVPVGYHVEDGCPIYEVEPL